MTRADVETYLDSKKVRYSAVFVGRDNAWSYETNIAQEPSDSLFCESWMVYVAFDFSSSGNELLEAKPQSADILKDIRIRKSGNVLTTCAEFDLPSYSICTSSLALDSGVATGAGFCGARHASKIET